ncbi:MAG: hypothetical protein H7126_01890 [Candidatus Parcubacteria bacterium]|uniref:hypothetical protein n=1 Tax=Phormidesmis priestleyi TaxID=268141 RepID=UPI000839E177|nr:hypothetical protein [Phormidesmis priestleyi]MBC7822628.1 hypothetical protein [Leptolyngbyaceae cyanobacterium LF-bin-113]
MSIQKSHYEELLAAYSQPAEAIALLKHYRAYLEMLPSMRRSEESVITIPLPIVKLRHSSASASGHMNITTVESLMLPCEVAIVLCDPEWKIKTGREIFIFIHQPEEDFSDLLGRWRRIQILLDKDYEWVMPPRYQHILSEGAAKIYPLFVVFEETPERIKKGLKGAYLPFVTQTLILNEEEAEEIAPEAVKPEDQKRLP